MNVFLSTGGYKEASGIETATLYLEHGIDEIELSAGKYRAEQLRDLAALPETVLQLHNYFPPPNEPFVFNLASKNEEVLGQSLNLAKQAIEFTSVNACPAYGFHGGFLFDPLPKHLGSGLAKDLVCNRSDGFEAFLDNVFDLADFAREHGVKLLVENNVLNKRNLELFNGNPLLLVDPEELAYFASMMPENVGLLMDVAHLKVSANTLGFDMAQALRDLGQYTGAYHLSDNDGQEDTNGLISDMSWFWPHLDPNVTNFTVEVYSPNVAVLNQQISLVKNQLF